MCIKLCTCFVRVGFWHCILMVAILYNAIYSFRVPAGVECKAWMDSLKIIIIGRIIMIFHSLSYMRSSTKVGSIYLALPSACPLLKHYEIRFSIWFLMNSYNHSQSFYLAFQLPSPLISLLTFSDLARREGDMMTTTTKTRKERGRIVIGGGVCKLYKGKPWGPVVVVV